MTNDQTLTNDQIVRFLKAIEACRDVLREAGLAQATFGDVESNQHAFNDKNLIVINVALAAAANAVLRY